MTAAPSGPAADLPRLRRRIAVALGREAGDLAITGVSVVNVFTGRVERADVVVADGVIAGVGPYEWRAERAIPADGMFVLPGLIDSHMHLESTLLTPAELARLVVPHGTAAVIADPHENGNVTGVRGIERLLAAGRGLPMDLFYMAPSCVPCLEWDDSGARLDAAAVAELMGRLGILGLAEVMDFPAVLAGGEDKLSKILAGSGRRAVLDGHAPGLVGREIVAYAAAGIRSDHECVTADEARQRAALGMLVQVREGSVARNLDTLLPAAAAGELGDWAPCTDDIYPDELRAHGHLDGLLRRIVAGGVPPAVAVRHATLVPARHYGLSDRGAVAPGLRADLCVVEDLREFRVHAVVKDGRLAAQDGHYLAETPAAPIPEENTVRVAVAGLDESAFRLSLSSDAAPVIRVLPGQIVTKAETSAVRREAGRWTFDVTHDVVMIASLERHRATGRIGLGLAAGFGLTRGAIGSSVAHDSHNLVVAGTNARDMAACVRALAETGGGFVVCEGGRLLARLPLPVAGLLSDAPTDAVCRRLDEVGRAAALLGSPLPNPFGTLSFTALPVIPELRITSRGLFDVRRMEFVGL
jgi:adenine deaminase